MTSRDRVIAAMQGGRPEQPPVSLYITWPEYAWRYLDMPLWEVILGEYDGIEAWDRVLSRHPADFAPGPVGKMGSGWLRGKRLERQDDQSATFRCEETGRRWRFDLTSHSLFEIDEAGAAIDRAHSFERSGDTPHTIAEANAWFRNRYNGASNPAHDPSNDRAIAKWKPSGYFMVTCTIGPFVAVVFAFGYENAMVLLAERPRVFAHLESLYLQHFEDHYSWAARAGYDGGHIVESYCSADTISPDTYERWVAPIHRDTARMIQSKGLKADLYIPGFCMPLLQSLAAQRWDALRLDDLCRGYEQDIADARRILGPEQCLFGNMSAHALLRGDWADIEARARYQYEMAGKGKAFIISNGSGICDATDPAIIDRWLAYARSLHCSH